MIKVTIFYTAHFVEICAARHKVALCILHAPAEVAALAAEGEVAPVQPAAGEVAQSFVSVVVASLVATVPSAV